MAKNLSLLVGIALEREGGAVDLTLSLALSFA